MDAAGPGRPVTGAPAEVDGVVHRRSPYSVEETSRRLTAAVAAAGATVFATIDQRQEAERVGLELRDTVLVVFGNPAAGTPVMAAAPLSALDLPLKVLIWVDDDRAVWMSYLSAEWLAQRYALGPELSAPLRAPEVLSGRVVTD